MNSHENNTCEAPCLTQYHLIRSFFIYFDTIYNSEKVLNPPIKTKGVFGLGFLEGS